MFSNFVQHLIHIFERCCTVSTKMMRLRNNSELSIYYCSLESYIRWDLVAT